MLRLILTVTLSVATLAIVSSGNAQDKKDETKKFEGTLTCTKCALSETAKCGHALLVKVDGKEIKYYLLDKGGAEKYHSKCCSADVAAIVTGKAIEKDGKKFIDAPKVEFPKN